MDSEVANEFTSLVGTVKSASIEVYLYILTALIAFIIVYFAIKLTWGSVWNASKGRVGLVGGGWDSGDLPFYDQIAHDSYIKTEGKEQGEKDWKDYMSLRQEHYTEIFKPDIK